MAQYYLVKDGQRIGPLTVDQLMPNGLTKDTLVWTEGMANWTKAGEVADLAARPLQHLPQRPLQLPLRHHNQWQLQQQLQLHNRLPSHNINHSINNPINNHSINNLINNQLWEIM